MSGKLLTTSVLCALLTGANMISGGVNAESVYELTPVIVTATKTAESAEKVPASVSVVTAKEIAAHNYSSTAQAFGQLPGVYLSPVGDGGISMRGFGAASSLYGGRAVGGVIQIITKKSKDEGLHGDVLLSTGSNSTTKQTYDAKFKKDKWDVDIGYEKRKTDGWRG